MTDLFADKNGYSEEVLAEAFNPRSLELIILPTEKCNFRCTYCYEDFAIGKMRKPVQRGIVSLINNRAPSLDSLRLSWFGGEPLLAIDVVKEISSTAMDICHDYGVNFGGGMTTNGYLLDHKTLKGLCSLKQNHFQITLDGSRNEHDLSRLRADGRGTFDKIWENLCAARISDLDFHILIRIHVSPSNLSSVQSLIKDINEKFSDDSRFSVHFHRVSDLGGPNSGEIAVLSMADYRAELTKLKSNLNLHSDSEIELASKGICYAAKVNSLLVRANGRLGKCTVALSDPRNDIGHINEDGSISVDNERLRLWLNGFTDLNDDALGCPLSNLTLRTGVGANLGRLKSSPKVIESKLVEAHK
ncbi:MAG TPA: radical SAM protein [Chiayiivirga sp.]|nr:radical SAM protein [Chiayiivirga sp.]